MTREPDPDIALKMLPPVLFRAALARLKGGHSVRAVSRWLMTQHRGPLQHFGFYDIRKEVLRLKDLIGRDEELDDPPPQLQGREDSEGPSAYDVQFQKLLDMAKAGRAIGRDVLNFVLCTELQRVRDLRQKDGSHGQVNTVLQHLRRIGEQLCQVGAGSGIAWENYDQITIENEDSERMQQLSEKFERMSVADRMVLRHMFGLRRRILKLKAKIAAEEKEKAAAGQAGAPEEPKP